MSQNRCLCENHVSAKFKRGSGIMLPIFSLPSKGGIGTLGIEAYNFVDFLEEAKQKYWQVLPIGHTGFGDSPYSCYSFFAGNPLFIDITMIEEEGLVQRNCQIVNELKAQEDNSRINYGEVIKQKYNQLWKVYKNCRTEIKTEILEFLDKNEKWVYDYGIFMALKDQFDGKPIWEWPEKIRKRDNETIGEYWNKLRDRINFYLFIQFLFFKQWNKLKEYANTKGIKIIGDMPIYPAADSCEIWTHPELFKVDFNTLKAQYVSGVPGEEENDPGQNWGNPVYNWQQNKDKNYSWIKYRYQHCLEIYDIVRLDHFRGYANYWEIPAKANSPIEGMWKQGPGMNLFNSLFKDLGKLNCIAEDLGNIDDEVFDLINQTGFQGMKVMIYGLHQDENNMYLPHNWSDNCVAYLSTHDSETLLEAINNLSNKDREFAVEYVGKTYSIEDLTDCFIRTIYQSNANIVILTMQDLLRLGKEGRMNIPGTVNSNWSWRIDHNIKEKDIMINIKEKLSIMVETYKR